MINDIQTMCIENPRAFWEHIKKIERRKSNHIPMKVYQGNELVSDIDVVLNKWKTDF